MARFDFLRKGTAAFLFLALAVSPAEAQDLGLKGAPQSRPLVIRGATLHTVSGGTIENGTIAFAEGRIVAVGTPAETAAAVATLADPQGIDGAGLRVVPGFVYASSVLGMAEVGAVDMSLDLREAGSIKPEVWAAVAVNPDSWHIPVARRNGVLVAGLFPQGGLVPGRVSVVQLDGWTGEDMTLVADAGLSVSWPFLGPRPAGRFGRFRGGPVETTDGTDRLGTFFDRALAYHSAREAGEDVLPDLRFDSMRSVLFEHHRVFVAASTARQIESAVLWCVERGLHPVIVGGTEADRCVELLVRHQVPVVLTGAHRLPRRRDEAYESSYELPGVLEAAGVDWSMSLGADADAASNARNLPYEVAACVAYGLPWEAALRSLTLSPARALGVGERVGSLEVGKDATLFLCHRDPLDLDAGIVDAYVQGRKVDLRDKQTELEAKYRTKYQQLGLLPRSNGEVP